MLTFVFPVIALGHYAWGNWPVNQKMCPQRDGLCWEEAAVPLTGIKHGDSVLVWGGIYKTRLRPLYAVVPVYQKHTVTSFLNSFSEAGGEMAVLGGWWGGGWIHGQLSVQLEGGAGGGGGECGCSFSWCPLLWHIYFWNSKRAS